MYEPTLETEMATFSDEFRHYIEARLGVLFRTSTNRRSDEDVGGLLQRHERWKFHHEIR